MISKQPFRNVNVLCLFNFRALYRVLLNVIIITNPKCSEVLNVITFQRNCSHSPNEITFGLKCNITLNEI